MPQVVPDAIRPHRSEVVHSPLVLYAIAASIFALGVLSTENYQPLLIAGALGCCCLVVWAIPYTTRHTEWLIFVIGLMYLVISTSLLSEQVRAVLHYGVLLAFCLPIIARPYKSRLLREGNFKLYCCYFTWALATICYSLAPAFSAGRWIGAALGFCAVTACVTEIRESRDCYRLLTRFLIACSIGAAATLIAAAFLPSSLTWQTPADGLDPGALMHLREQGTPMAGMDRFRGLFGNANDVGSMMLITVSTALVCFNGATRYQRLLLALVSIVAIGLAVRADSRSPFVGLIAGAGLYVLWRYRIRGAVAITLMLVVALGALSALGDIDSYVTRGDVGTLTGRTDMWAYVIEKVWERPLLGYGYEVGGAIFDNRNFTLWYGPWDQGPHSSLHNGYLTHFIGVGIPGTVLWLFIVLRPWVFIFRQGNDPWNLKTTGLLMVVPLLIYNLTEAALGDFMGQTGFLFGLAWAIAERYRTLEMARAVREQVNALEGSPPAVRALRER